LTTRAWRRTSCRTRGTSSRCWSRGCGESAYAGTSWSWSRSSCRTPYRCTWTCDLCRPDSPMRLDSCSFSSGHPQWRVPRRPLEDKRIGGLMQGLNFDPGGIQVGSGDSPGTWSRFWAPTLTSRTIPTGTHCHSER
jgi:hypothetical protein